MSSCNGRDLELGSKSQPLMTLNETHVFIRRVLYRTEINLNHSQAIQYKLCLLMYSVCQQQCPVCVSNMVQSVANSTHRQGLRSSTCPTFVVPRTRTKLGERAVSVSGRVAWNALPATIRNTTDSILFKRLLLKSHFYNRSFDITA